MQELYRLTGPPPCKTGDVIQIGKWFFVVKQMESLYYEFRRYLGTTEIGFLTERVPVPDLVPPANKVYYISGFGIQGLMKVQLVYQSGSPRNTVGSRGIQRLDWNQAPYDIPFQTPFAIVVGDTLEVDVQPLFPYLKGAIWFYGHKLSIVPYNGTPEKVVLLEDVREM